MHFCEQELYALLMLIPFVSYFRNWVVNVWRKRHQKPNCTHGENHEQE